MNRVLFTLMSVVALGVFAVGCSKDEETNPLTPGGGTTLGQATCQIDGAARTFVGVALIDTTGDGSGGMYLGGFSAAGTDTVLLEMFIGTPNPANGSSHALGEANYGGLYYTNTGAVYSTNTTSTGTLAVGTNGATAITGTFSFTARQIEGTGTKSVTGGNFNFPKSVGAAQDAPRIMREAMRLAAGR
jgi:hypothetical protein